MITIRNKQRKITVNVNHLHKQAQILLDALRYSDFDLGILLTNNAGIRRYNREFRHKDKPTDILSFPYHAALKAGEHIKPETDEDKNLGDLIISLEYVKKDAANLKTSFEDRLKLLLVHGICHLLGYDHVADADYKIMHKKELALLKQLK